MLTVTPSHGLTGTQENRLGQAHAPGFIVQGSGTTFAVTKLTVAGPVLVIHVPVQPSVKYQEIPESRTLIVICPITFY